MLLRKIHEDRMNTFTIFLIFAKKIADFSETNKLNFHRYRKKLFQKFKILTVLYFLKISSDWKNTLNLAIFQRSVMLFLSKLKYMMTPQYNLQSIDSLQSALHLTSTLCSKRFEK